MLVSYIHNSAISEGQLPQEKTTIGDFRQFHVTSSPIRSQKAGTLLNYLTSPQPWFENLGRFYCSGLSRQCHLYSLADNSWRSTAVRSPVRCFEQRFSMVRGWATKDRARLRTRCQYHETLRSIRQGEFTSDKRARINICHSAVATSWRGRSFVGSFWQDVKVSVGGKQDVIPKNVWGCSGCKEEATGRPNSYVPPR